MKVETGGVKSMVKWRVRMGKYIYSGGGHFLKQDN